MTWEKYNCVCCGRKGALLREATELLGVYYSGGHAWLKDVQVEKWGRVPGMTAWEDPLGHRRICGRNMLYSS